MNQILSAPSQLGPLLKAARKAAGLSQQQLAQRLGISQSRMSHMELHPRSVNLGQLLALLAVLGLEVQVGPRPGATRGMGAHAQPSARPSAPPASEW